MLKRFAIISGEPSGDQYAAELIQDIRHSLPHAEFVGMGGEHSQAAGLVPWPKCNARSIMGFNLLKQLRYARKLLSTIHTHLKNHPPECLILIDYSGINLRVLKQAKRLNIPCIYYVPPKTWAWGKGRVKQLLACAKVCVHYPFEYAYFKDHHVPITLVKHPFFAKAEAFLNIKKSTQHTTIALLPGSRVQEITTHLPIMLEGVYQLQKQHPTKTPITCSVIISQDTMKSHILPVVQAWSEALSIKLISPGHKLKAIACANAALVCSGTASFEVAALNTPMLIVYKTYWFTYYLARFLVRIRFIGLPNLIQNRAIVPELIQQDCSPLTIAKHLHSLLQNPMTQQQELKHLCDTMKHDSRIESIDAVLNSLSGPDRV